MHIHTKMLAILWILIGILKSSTSYDAPRLGAIVSLI